MKEIVDLPPAVRFYYECDERPRKDGFDCLLAALALFLLMPVMLASAFAIRLESRGPALFRQRRFGKGRRIFTIYKFRTMTVMEDGETVLQATTDDPRITCVGRILRRTRMDELPQLINVIQGDMALVGPRPHAIVHDIGFARTVDKYWLRYCVKPGITGWAQIHGYCGEIRSVADISSRLRYDLDYIENWSIWLDLSIMIRTIPAILRGPRSD
jgi:lipopolysaccharide/colanic/teichoic acid biosynthesis glycosyltransferase